MSDTEDKPMTLEELMIEVRLLQETGKLPKRPTREEAIDWAYGNAHLSNPDVTREMVERAYDEKNR